MRTLWEYTPTDYEPRKMQGELTAGPIMLTISEVLNGIEPPSQGA